MLYELTKKLSDDIFQIQIIQINAISSFLRINEKNEMTLQ